jgi:hypothetical protein
MNDWFEKVDSFLFEKLLSFQNKFTGINFEIGVYKGSSLESIAKNDTNNPCFGLDIFDEFLFNDNYINDAKLVEQNYSNVKLIKSNSFDYDFSQYKNKIKFFHIDGNHQGKFVKKDIENAIECLTEDGILILDDFNNKLFPDIAKAFYKTESDFIPLILSLNKAYFVRKNVFDKYYKFIESIINELKTIFPQNFIIKTINSLEENYFVLVEYYYILNDKNKKEYEIIYGPMQ